MKWVGHAQMMSNSTAESRALRKSAELFKKGLDPNSVASKLYSRGLLTPDEYSKATTRNIGDYERVDEIFKSVERRVATAPDDFHELVRILSDIEGQQGLAKKLQGSSYIIIAKLFSRVQ